MVGLLLASVALGEATVRFVDVAAEVGLTLGNVSGGTAEKWSILESTGGGACFLDVEGDGDLDLFLVNGGRLEAIGAPVRDALYLNDGDGRFIDGSEAAGLVESAWGGGCAVGDVDNDGDADLYVTNYGPDAFYRNRGDGTFEDATVAAGLGDPRWGIGASFFDADADGDLDLYVAHYLRFAADDPYGRAARCRWKGGEVMCGPRGFEGEPDAFYRNRGDGTFEDAASAAGVGRDAGYGMGVVAGDVDDDGDTDLFVANDSQANLLWINDGAGRFVDRALEAGVALSGDGRAQAGMGADWGDVDGDGDPDLVVTHFSDDYHALYRNDGGLLFTDASAAAGLDPLTRPSLGWGGGFFDFDNDGDLDLFVASGHVYPGVERFDPATRYRQPSLLLENDGRGRFRDVAAEAGLVAPGTGRGAAFGDWDDDGDLDVVVVHLDAPPELLRNDGGNAGGWIKLRLVGRASNRDGTGARLRLDAGGRTQVREARTGGGYASSNDPRLHFGLGTASTVERLEIRWPSGRIQELGDLPAGHLVTIDEDAGVVSAVRLQQRGSGATRSARHAPPAPAAATVPSRVASGTRLTLADLQRVDALAQEGTRRIQAGRPAEGVTLYEQALVLLPPWAAASASVDALGFGARERYRAFLVSLFDNLGVALMRAERLDECAEPIERAIELEPSRAKLHNNLGLCHFHARRYPQAIAALEAAARATDPPPGLPYDLGRALAGAGRCDEAEPALGAALAALPVPDPRGRDAEAWYLLGGCRADRGRLGEAADAFRETLRRVPGHQKALYRLAVVWRRQGLDRAASEAARLFAARQPADEAVRALERSGAGVDRLFLGRAYLDAGLAPRALQQAEEALAAEPRSVAARVLLGDALLALHPPAVERAGEAFAATLAGEAESPAALVGLGRALLLAGRDAEAERWLRKAGELAPEATSTTVALAQLEAATGSASAAIARLEARLATGPRDPELLRALAELYLDGPDPSTKAPEALRLLAEAGGLYGEGVDLRVRALALAGEEAEAERLARESAFPALPPAHGSLTKKPR